eukprot:TRINITY_DN64491_c0_g1_i1.p1 TRINITY_DN64491_c0_g1~~TRINITY_DN64491_c0_g1_i1.p1  ORF type:complete len:345 (-),score=49.05 TRINITY_DN64491_c0_g1_i1:276-1247(-)
MKLSLVTAAILLSSRLRSASRRSQLNSLSPLDDSSDLDAHGMLWPEFGSSNTTRTTLPEDRSLWPQSLRDCSIQLGSESLQLTRFLGGGGSGRVFSLGDDRAAVKLLPGDNPLDAVVELRIYQALEQAEGAVGRSPFLLHLAAGAESRYMCCGYPCTVLEFVPGETVSSLLSDYKPHAARSLSMFEAKSIACQALHAFADMEFAGISISDLNEQNMMIGTDVFKIIDLVNLDFPCARWQLSNQIDLMELFELVKEGSPHAIEGVTISLECKAWTPSKKEGFSNLLQSLSETLETQEEASELSFWGQQTLELPTSREAFSHLQC